MPMRTRLETSRFSSGLRPQSSRSSRATITWPTISAAVRLLHQPLGAGVAERAGEGAADLARDAERATVGLGDVDRLDLRPAGDAQEVLAGAVRRDLPRHDLGPLDGEALGEPFAIRPGEVAHDGEVAGAAMVDPLPNLRDAHGRLRLGGARRDQRLAERRPAHADDVGPLLRRRAARKGQDVGRDRSSSGHRSGFLKCVARRLRRAIAFQIANSGGNCQSGLRPAVQEELP